MVIEIIIRPSDRKDKKYMAIIDDKKRVHFGSKGASDYTINKDDERKERYIKRHQKNEDWNNFNTAGFWSKNILWNRPTITESIRDINNKFTHLFVRKGDARF